jgi:predicted metal-dependent peptidase
MDLNLKLAKARTSLILDHPFFGAVALNMPMVFDASTPTACTDGKQVRFNPDFVASLTDEETRFLVAHECCHPMFEHLYRMKGRDASRWNQAADYVINQLLVDEKLGKFIKGGCLDSSLYQQGKGTAEGIYNLLPKDQRNGGIGDDMQDPGGSEAEQAQEAAEWRVKVAQAAQAAKMMGKLSANLRRVVDEALTPKVSWKDVLQRFMQKARVSTRTWARPNRRFLAQGLYMPSVSGEALGEIVVAVDCSGSIGRRELNEFSAEIKALHEDGRPAALHVVYFDSKVCHYDRFDADDTVTISAKGDGGTAFSPVFRYLSANNIEPVATVFLTDLHCDDFGPMPDYPVLWVSNGATRAPWGEVVKL